MLRSLLNVYSISLLLSSSCLANPGDKVIIQLLVDDKEMSGLHQKVKKDTWDGSNKIAFPHVSFIEVDDANNIIKSNYKEFVENISSFLIKKSKESNLQFTGQGVNPYNSQHTGVTYWCLEDVDKSSSSPFNSALKSVGEETKKSIKDFILSKKSRVNNSSTFTMKSPEEASQGLAQLTKETGESCVEFSKGFPHVSLAKGIVRTSSFDTLVSQHVTLNIKGANFVYTYAEEPCRIPQIFIKTMFGNPGYTFHSQFESLRRANGYHLNSDGIFNCIGGLNAPSLETEIERLRAITRPSPMQSSRMDLSPDVVNEIEKEKPGTQTSYTQQFQPEMNNCPVINKLTAEQEKRKAQIEELKQQIQAKKLSIQQQKKLAEQESKQAAATPETTKKRKFHESDAASADLQPTKRLKSENNNGSTISVSSMAQNGSSFASSSLSAQTLRVSNGNNQRREESSQISGISFRESISNKNESSPSKPGFPSPKKARGKGIQISLPPVTPKEQKAQEQDENMQISLPTDEGSKSNENNKKYPLQINLFSQ